MLDPIANANAIPKNFELRLLVNHKDNLMLTLTLNAKYHIGYVCGRTDAFDDIQCDSKLATKQPGIFFSFNSFATSLDNSTHPRTIELAKFGTACDNVIIPAAVGVFFSPPLFSRRLDSRDCNPALSPFHGGSLGLGLFTETLWNGSRVVSGIPAMGWRATPHIWYNLQKLLRRCPRFDGDGSSWAASSVGIKPTT